MPVTGVSHYQVILLLPFPSYRFYVQSRPMYRPYRSYHKYGYSFAAGKYYWHHTSRRQSGFSAVAIVVFILRHLIKRAFGTGT